MLTSRICGSSRILAADLSEKLATTQPSSQILLHNAMSMMVKPQRVILRCIQSFCLASGHILHPRSERRTTTRSRPHAFERSSLLLFLAMLV
jgi:hypothetical protein